MTRPIGNIVVGIIAITWMVVMAIAGKPLDRQFLAPFSTAVGVLLMINVAYDRWLWPLPVFHLLSKKPCLTGTWLGELRSDYKRDPADDDLAPIQGVMVVTQTASGLHVRQFTRESSSTSVAASIEAEEGDRFSFSTVYRNEPGLDLQARSPIHYGATRLAIEGEPRNPKKLKGFYWTARSPAKTAGTMTFEFVTRKAVHSFEEGVSAKTDRSWFLMALEWYRRKRL